MIVGVIGHGLIGRERVEALAKLRDEGVAIDQVHVTDPVASGQPLPSDFAWCGSVEDLLDNNPEWIIVATPHDVAVPVVTRALSQGSSVLVEKPMGRTLAEASELLACQPAPGRLFVGMNYRFFAGINRLLADVRAGEFGRIVSVNMTLGHGGTPGMEQSWKLDQARAGGGCLLDPGVHLLDLCRLLLPGQLKPLAVSSWRGFWKTGIEEEAHLLLQSDGCLVNLQTSIVRWRSQCAVQVNGTDGYGVVQGRGRSYGPQRYVRGRRWGWRDGGSQEASEVLVVESSAADSFVQELRALFTRSSLNGVNVCSADEGVETMRLYTECCERMAIDRGETR